MELLMSNNVKKKEALVPSLKYYLEELRKIMKDFNDDNRHPGQGLNSGPLEYEAGVSSVTFLFKSFRYKFSQCFGRR
jgi:hypothetical protein